MRIKNKKLVAATLSAILVAMLAVVPAQAAYPSSVEEGLAAPAEGQLLTGEFIGTNGWGDNPDVDFNAAFDGDIYTFFDPLGVGEENFAGVKLAEAATLLEVRIHPRENFVARFNGATIQGSNDGTTWTDLWESMGEADEWEFQVIKADQLKNNTGYTHYRYVNNFDHGDVAEVEFWAPVAVAAESEPEPVVEEVPQEAATPAPVEAVAPVEVAVATPVAAPQTGGIGIVFSLAALVSGAVGATKIAARKRR